MKPNQPSLYFYVELRLAGNVVWTCVSSRAVPEACQDSYFCSCSFLVLLAEADYGFCSCFAILRFVASSVCGPRYQSLAVAAGFVREMTIESQKSTYGVADGPERPTLSSESAGAGVSGFVIGNETEIGVVGGA